MSNKIDAILAVPDDIEFAIREWSNADGPEAHQAWLAVGKAIDAHVEERIANALRLERGGCKFCPAAKGEAHRFGCKAPKTS